MVHGRLGTFVLCALVGLMPLAARAQAWLAADGEWRVAGGNLADSHASPLVWQIRPDNAAGLTPRPARCSGRFPRPARTR
ncbi:MAG: hypothetical protein JWO51_2982 [Rhodospirillales bacterium]|nr:hypothetical protein [Rhodospirillales bacterium]